MFPGAIDLHTRYFMDQFTRLDQCDILPSDMRDNNYGIVDSRCLRFAGATQTAYLHERPRTHIWDSQSPYPKTYDFRGWNVWRCLTLEVAGLIVSIPLDQVFVHSSMCLKHTTCVDRKPVWRILTKLHLIPSHSLNHSPVHSKLTATRKPPPRKPTLVKSFDFNIKYRNCITCKTYS